MLILNDDVKTLPKRKVAHLGVWKEGLDSIPLGNRRNQNDNFHGQAPLRIIFIPFQIRILLLIVV
jgi:hypothetical protein